LSKIYLPIVSTGDRWRGTVCSRATLKRGQANLATFNIGYDPKHGGSAPFARVEAVGLQFDTGQDAEVVALQEVMYGDGRFEVAMFRDRYPKWHYFVVPHNLYQFYMNMIVSCHPFVPSSGRTFTIESNEDNPDREVLSIQVRHPSGVFRVFNLHTRAGEAKHGVQQALQWVKQVTEQEAGVPFAVMGDFNLTRAGVLDIANKVGLQVRCTTAGRIDHILVNGFKIAEQCVVPRPLVEGQHDPLFVTVDRV
jgi:endonuclease/exonuclease/phosphatase family metal-dependent hydrolase